MIKNYKKISIIAFACLAHSISPYLEKALCDTKQPQGMEIPEGITEKEELEKIKEWGSHAWEGIKEAKKNGADIVDDFICTLNIAECDWHNWEKCGKPQNLDNRSITKGDSFHLDCVIYNLKNYKERNLSLGEWCNYGFTPYIELVETSNNKIKEVDLNPTASNENCQLWVDYHRGKERNNFQVPPGAFGKIETVLSNLEVGDYKITIIIKFSKGVLRSNSVRFSITKETS